MTSRDLRIRRLTVHRFAWSMPGLGYDSTGTSSAVAYAQVAMVGPYLIGRSALQREQIWNDLEARCASTTASAWDRSTSARQLPLRPLGQRVRSHL